MRWFGLLASWLCLAANGCQTVPPIPPADLSQPGWKVREGQALWRRNRAAPELAGDVLIASRGEDQTFVQFSKTPIPVALAQRTGSHWQIELPTQNKRFAGRGRPPAGLVFIWLPQLLEGRPAPRAWSAETLAEDHWRLSNRNTGESLDVYLTP